MLSLIMLLFLEWHFGSIALDQRQGAQPGFRGREDPALQLDDLVGLEVLTNPIFDQLSDRAVTGLCERGMPAGDPSRDALLKQVRVGLLWILLEILRSDHPGALLVLEQRNQSQA